MRSNQFRAACPGIGWEPDQRQPTGTIGGRSPQWHTPPTDNPATVEALDEDAVIVRGTD